MCYRGRIPSLKTHVHTRTHAHAHTWVGVYVWPTSEATTATTVVNQSPPTTDDTKETWAADKRGPGVQLNQLRARRAVLEEAGWLGPEKRPRVCCPKVLACRDTSREAPLTARRSPHPARTPHVSAAPRCPCQAQSSTSGPGSSVNRVEGGTERGQNPPPLTSPGSLSRGWEQRPDCDAGPRTRTRTGPLLQELGSMGARHRRASLHVTLPGISRGTA